MILRQIAQYLAAQGLGTYDESGLTVSTIFIDLFPEPQNTISIRQYSGLQGDSLLRYDNPNIQVLVRGSLNPIASREIAVNIYNALHGFHHSRFIPEAQGGFYVVSCFNLNSGPIYLNQDENGFYLYSLNFALDYLNTGIQFV